MHPLPGKRLSGLESYTHLANAKRLCRLLFLEFGNHTKEAAPISEPYPKKVKQKPLGALQRFLVSFMGTSTGALGFGIGRVKRPRFQAGSNT